MNSWSDVPIDKLQKLEEILANSQDPVDLQALEEVVAEMARRRQAGETDLGGASQEAIDRLARWGLGPEAPPDVPAVPITAADSPTIAQRERLDKQQRELEAAYKAEHPYLHAGKKAADWGKSITTPGAMGAMGAAITSIPFLLWEAAQMTPHGAGAGGVAQGWGKGSI